MGDGQEPRIPPLPRDEWSEEIAAILGATFQGSDRRLGDNNIFATLARHPDLFRPWLRFGGYLLGAGTLDARDRELLILRTGANCGSSYEWGQHVRIAGELGIDRADIDRVLEGPGAAGWDDGDALLLTAADELHDASVLSDTTWGALAERFDERQLIEIVAVVGQYHLVAFLLNSLGVQLDDGLEALPD
jgi:alkylhydroperoxidase family enzyme